MEWFLFLFINLLPWILFLQADANLYRSTVSKAETNWTQAAYTCDLVTPPIQFSRKENTVNIHGIPEIEVWNIVWVGYVMKWTAFDYLGCVDKADIFRNSIPQFLDTKDDPGQCYSACGYSELFGILFHECYCLTKEAISAVQNKRKFCNQCLNGHPAPQGPACGTYNITSNIALYKVNKAVDENSDIPVNELTSDPYKVCLGYMPKKDSYKWARCAAEMRTVCKYDDGKVRPRADLAPWIGSMIRCHKNQSDPVTFADMRVIGKDSSDSWMWTGVVRSQIIYRYTDHLHPARQDITRFGYVTKHPLDGFVLKFTPDNFKYWALCLNGKSPLSTTYVSPTETTGTSAWVTDGTYGTVSSTLETTVIRETRSASQTGTNVPVYVLVLVIVVFTLVIVGLVALLLWKTQKHKNQYTGNQTVANNVAYSNVYSNKTESDGPDDVFRTTGSTARPLDNLQQGVADDHYEEPLSIQTTNSFHSYDTPPSNQPSTTDHYDKPKQGRVAGAYESLGPKDANNYDKVKSSCPKYDTPQSNQPSATGHFDKTKEGQMVEAYESLGPRNAQTYDSVIN